MHRLHELRGAAELILSPGDRFKTAWTLLDTKLKKDIARVLPKQRGSTLKRTYVMYIYARHRAPSSWPVSSSEPARAAPGGLPDDQFGGNAAQHPLRAAHADGQTTLGSGNAVSAACGHAMPILLHGLDRHTGATTVPKHWTAGVAEHRRCCSCPIEVCQIGSEPCGSQALRSEVRGERRGRGGAKGAEAGPKK